MVPGLETLPVVDPELRAELEMVGGAELPAQLVNMFLDDVGKLLVQINEAVGAGEGTPLSRLAHRIKGGAAAVGARRVAAVAKAIELAGKEGRVQDVPALLPVLEHELSALRGQF